MNTIKKSLIKTAKNAHNRCLYLQTYENDLPSLWTPPIKLYNILGGKTAQIN